MARVPAIDIRMIGDKRLVRKFNRLPDKLQKKMLRPAMRKAMKPIKAMAETLIPVGSGALKAGGLKISALKRSRSRFGIILATPTRATLGIPGEASGYYPIHVELGHRVVIKGKTVGKVAGQSYMRKAMEATKPQARKILANELRRRIAAEAKKKT
jgi:HK97 gp10 family phage protein